MVKLCHRRNQAGRKNLTINGNPKVEVINGRMRKKLGDGTIVIPALLELDELMRKVPNGKLITISEIRAALATKHYVTIGCPLTTGIFVWMSAHAAEESNKNKERPRLLPIGGL